MRLNLTLPANEVSKVLSEWIKEKYNLDKTVRVNVFKLSGMEIGNSLRVILTLEVTNADR